jgi:hypothetical protein
MTSGNSGETLKETERNYLLKHYSPRLRAKDDAKYLDIITQVKQMMFAYKLEGAAAGLLHANIIARELGLKEQSEVNTNANINILNIDPLADGE